MRRTLAREADAQQIGSLAMEDKLGPAARLVDFLLGRTLDSGLKMHFQIQEYERAYPKELQPNVSDRYSDERDEGLLEYAEEME